MEALNSETIRPIIITADKDKLPLYKFNAPMNFDAYFYIYLRDTRKILVFWIILLLVFLFTSALLIKSRHFFIAVIFAAMSFGYIIKLFNIKAAAKKNFEMIKKDFTLLSFYDDHFTIQAENIACYYNYSDVYRVTETKRLVCIYVNKECCQPIPKALITDEKFYNLLKEKFILNTI